MAKPFEIVNAFWRRSMLNRALMVAPPVALLLWLAVVTLGTRSTAQYFTAKVEHGDISQVVQATGTINPVNTVPVGSVVSGNVVSLSVDYNSQVKKGDILAQIDPVPFAMSAQCNRVAVEDGHTESIAIRLKKKAKAEEIIAAWNDFRAEPQHLKLPTAPDKPVEYMTAPDHPQPRLHVDLGAGMTTAVGRLRKCNVLDWKFTVLSHNTIRGAAGAALLNAELLKVKGYL